MPVTICLVAVSVVLFLADFFTQGKLGGYFSFQLFSGRLISPPWTPLAYPLLTPSPIAMLFGGLWLWWVGGSLERSWGSTRFATFFVVATLVSAGCLWGGALILHAPLAGLGDIWPVLAVLTVAWASINPYEPVVFYFVIRMQARWMALITVGLVYFLDIGGGPLVGLFYLLAPLAAWYYVRGGFSVGVPTFNRRPRSRGPDLRFTTTPPARRESAGGRLNPFDWFRRWQERRHLEKLWRNSGFTDKDDRNGR